MTCVGPANMHLAFELLLCNHELDQCLLMVWRYPALGASADSSQESMLSVQTGPSSSEPCVLLLQDLMSGVDL